MVSNSKILTVSYGTFSCTLEGFDDSFDTMKAIAEYFRDLAADDRYFGAEPAAPDAEMLARIAEREISRRVEAHDTDGKIHLRAASSALTAAAPERAKSAPMDGADEAASETASAAAQPTAELMDSPAPRMAPRTSHPASESIADKLRRIRAVAAPGASAFPGSGFDEDENAEDFLSGATSHDVADDTEEDQQPAPFVAEGEVTAQPAEQTDQTEGGEEAATVANSADIEMAEADDAQAEEVDASAIAAEPDALDTDANPENAVETEDARAEDTADQDTDDDILSRLSAPDEAQKDSPDADTALGTDDGEDAPRAEATFAETKSTDSGGEANDLAAFFANDDDENAAQANAEIYDGDEDDGDLAYSSDEDTLSQLLADALSTDDAPEAERAADAPQTDELEAEAPPPLAARVVKMKRADLDAALADGDLHEEMDSAAPKSDLSDEAEADLRRELAEVEAELQLSRAPEAVIPHPEPAPASVEDDAVSDADAVAKDADLADDADEGAVDGADAETEDAEVASNADADETADRRAKRLDATAADAQAARIFDEADTQLEEPVANQRRNAIQHLRAAVAATKAERRAGGAMQEDVDDQPYRNDLQSAVRPRRPQPVAGSMTPRPAGAATQRPAPLKLVAEQRIDAPAAQPVRPRRITRADLASAEPSMRPDERSTTQDQPRDGGFAEFAERMGASNLTEMLEAAAAYMADVEGMPQFSRPMLMQKLREAQDEDFSREDGLRSFGQLLRQGKLQKLKGGRFAVTSVTEFRRTA